ncbi:MAG: tetratricopeptide repeat protein [Alkalispirochaeta sp.]
MEVREQIAQSEELIRLGLFDDAIELLTEVLADDPDNLSALLNIGIAYTESGHNDSAIQALSYYVQHDEENDEAWEALGCAYLRRKEYATAEDHLQRARGLNSTNASVLRNLSVLFSETGRGRESYDTLTKAYELNPNDYLTTYALATAYRYLERPQEARTLLERLQTFDYLPTSIRHEAEKHLLELTVGWT